VKGAAGVLPGRRRAGAADPARAATNAAIRRRGRPRRGARRRAAAGAGRGDAGRIRDDGRTVDALAPAAEEGRGHAAKGSGEALAAGDPEVSEWGNPPGAIPGHRCVQRGARGELKHLTTRRNRQDSPSSGERTGRSPNRAGATSQSALPVRGKDGARGGGD
jgi:hypothetical protein